MQDSFALYPIYFDIDRPHSKGRKFPLSSCLTKPTFNEICEALKTLEIEFTGEPTKRHPCDPFVYGRVKVNKMYNKKSVVDGIKNVVEEIRCNKKVIKAVDDGVDKKGYIKNELNLVPKKKKKGKKK